MSGLGNLFSGFSANADNNDALKYSAPKEPKVKAAKPAAVGSVTPAPTVAATTPPPAAAAAKAPGPSKIMSAASVRLYKVNAATGAYDAVENGGMLGCVMMGTNLTFQILVYNAQKAPQATVAVGAAFDFAVRDQYMSFADSAGNQWSLLFDSPEVMTTFVRTVAATVMHVASHMPDAAGDAVVRRLLPRSAPAGEGEEAVLAVGMSAGLYLTAWELQEAVDYPGDVLAGAPLKRVQAPDEVLKYKLSSSEDAIGGLSEALQGLRKGDRCLVGIPPRVFYKGAAAGPIEAARRAFPGSWLLVEVEVAKMKSGDAIKGAKKDKGQQKKEDEAPAPAPAPYSPESPAQRLAKRNNSATFQEDSQQQRGAGGGGGDMAARMAKVAAGGGGGGAGAQLAGIMNPHASQRRSDSADSRDRDGGRDGRNYEREQQPQRSYESPPRRRAEEPSRQQQQQRDSGDRYESHSAPPPQQQPYVEHRLAVVEGQGVRSFYTDAGEEDPAYYQPQQPQRGQQQQQQQQQQHQQAPRYQPGPSQADQQQTASSLNTLHQSVASVQQSMMALHTKLDQVGGQVTNSLMLQQQAQQQQALVSMGAGAGQQGAGMGMGMGGFGQGMGGMGMGGMPGMGMMGGYMNPLQQQQQLMFQQQQQQMQQQQMAPSHSLGSGPASATRLKTEELVGTLQALLLDFEKGGGAGGAAKGEAAAKEAEASRETIRTLRASVDKLEEKNESLQTRYDKLMGEKGELMEKYMDQFQTVSSATGKVFQAQQEAEALRQAKAQLEKEVEGLRAAGAGNGASEAAAREKEQEQKTLIAELQHKAMALQVEGMELKQALEAARSSSAGASTQQQQQLAEARAEADKLRAELEASRQEAAALRAANEALQSQGAEQAADFQRRLAEAQASSSQAGEAEALRSQLQAAQGAVSSLNQALESVAAKAVEASEQHEAAVGALQQQLASATSALAAKESSAGAGAGAGKADAEELKSIMQDVFVKACEVFDTEDADSAYSAQDVVKRLKGVLKKVTGERSAV